MATASVPPALPEQFGRYLIVRQLGQGGMGDVYLAHDTQLDRQVALKVPHLTAADGPDALHRFQREARAAAALDHPNLCRVHDVGSHNGVPYLTMAYVEGRTLADAIAGGKFLPPAEAAGIVRKLALAMHEAHAKGIIHRDLKPANVMINRRGEPVVMDFGLARLPSRTKTRLTQLGVMMGTPAYMPPEQVRGDVDMIGPGCDIYSLGVILFQLLTGHVPFTGSMDAVLGQILGVPPPSPSSYRPNLDPRLEAVCLRAMQKEIAARHTSMTELAHELTTCLGAPTSPIVASRPLRPTLIEAPAATPPPLQATMIETHSGLQKKPASQEATVVAPARSTRGARMVQQTPWRPGPKHWAGAGVVALATLALCAGMVALVFRGRNAPPDNESPPWQASLPPPASTQQPVDEYPALFARGQAALKQERLAEAEVAFAQAAKLRPQDGTADNLLQLARLHRQNAEAKLQEKQAAAQRAGRTAKLLADARTSIVEGNLAEARRQFNQASKLDPAAKDLQPALAQLEQAEQQRDTLKSNYDAAIKAGDTALAGKQFKKAVEQYDAAIRTITDADPTLAKQADPAGWLSLAEAAKAAAQKRRDALPAPAPPVFPTPFAGRSGEIRTQALQAEGGTQDSEKAVARGLMWLFKNQSPDGHWALDGAFKDKGTPNDVAGTAFGLLPFLGAGYAHKPDKDNPYDRVVFRGLAFLTSRQNGNTGDFGGGMYSHGLATIALCEAYGMTKDPNLRTSAQRAINYIALAQHRANGGWRYAPGQEGDTSVTGWQITALRTAQLAGLIVPDASIKNAIRYLNSCMSPQDKGYGYTGVASTPTMSAVGLLCRQKVQAWGPQKLEMIEGVKNHLRPAQPNAKNLQKNIYFYYYATQVMHQYGGEAWREWNEGMRDGLLSSQEANENVSTFGSWNSAGDPHSGAGGRLMITSLNLLTLEVYYRYPRVAPPLKE